MITVKQAVQAALAYVEDFADILPTGNVRLEETELLADGPDDDDPFWSITLSFLENNITGARSYKVFRIGALDGEVRAMKARSIAASR